MKKTISLLLVLSFLLSLTVVGAFQAGAGEALPLDGTPVSGVATQMNVLTPLSLVVAQRGMVEVTFSLSEFAEVDLRPADNSDKLFLLSPADDGSFKANTDMHQTLFLEKGSYTINIIKGNWEDVRFTVAALWKAFDFAEKAPDKNGETLINLPCNKELTCSLTEWTAGDTFQITVKKDYKIKLFVTAYCPLDIVSRSAGINDSLTEGTPEQPQTWTVEKMLKSGTYSVIAYSPIGNIKTGGGIYTIKMVVETIPQSPTGLKALTRKGDSITVSYNKVKGAAGYQVQCSDGGKNWAQTKTGASTSVCFKGLQQGGTYKFRVRSYVLKNGKKFFGLWSKTYTDCTKPGTPTIYNAASSHPGQAFANWKTQKGVCTAYQVYFSTDKSFKRVDKKASVYFEGKALHACPVFQLKSGKTYYVKVRAYTKAGTVTCYGGWTKVKAVKVK